MKGKHKGKFDGPGLDRIDIMRGCRSDLCPTLDPELRLPKDEVGKLTEVWTLQRTYIISGSRYEGIQI
jgi:hypothetical protein